MSGIVLDSFRGIAPRFSAKALPAGMAEQAENVNLELGQLNPMRVAIARSTVALGSVTSAPTPPVPSAVTSTYRTEVRFTELPVTSVSTTNDTLTLSADLELQFVIPAGTPVKVSSTDTLPSPLSSSTTYYVVSPSTNTIKLSTSVGGAAENLTTTGDGEIMIQFQPELVMPYWFVDSGAEYSRVRIAHVNDVYNRHVAARREVVTGANAYPQLITFEDGEKQEYRLGLPAPDTAPAAAPQEIPANTPVEEREYVSYIATYTDKFGYEGPPSSPSALYERLRVTSADAAEVDLAFDPVDSAAGTVSGAKAKYVGLTSASGPELPTWRLDCIEAVAASDDSSVTAPTIWYTKSALTGDGSSGELNRKYTAASDGAEAGTYTFECAAAGGNRGTGTVTVGATGTPNATGIVHVYCVWTNPANNGQARFYMVEMNPASAGYNSASPPAVSVYRNKTATLAGSNISVSISNGGGSAFKKGDCFYIEYKVDGAGAVTNTVIHNGPGLFNVKNPAGEIIRENVRPGKTYGSTTFDNIRFRIEMPTGPVGGVASLTTNEPFALNEALYFTFQKKEIVQEPDDPNDHACRWFPSGYTDVTAPQAYPNVTVRFQTPSGFIGGSSGLYDLSYDRDDGTPIDPTGMNAPWFIEIIEEDADADTVAEGGADTRYTVYGPQIDTLAASLASNVFTSVGHRLETGISTVRMATETGGPSGLVAGDVYYAIKITDDTFSIATSAQAAVSGTAVTLTDTTTVNFEAWCYYEAEKQQSNGSWTAIGANGLKANGTQYRVGVRKNSGRDRGSVHVTITDATTEAYRFVGGERYFFYTHDEKLSFSGGSSTYVLSTEDYEILDQVGSDGREPNDTVPLKTTLSGANATSDTVTFADGLRAPGPTVIRFTDGGSGVLPTPLEFDTDYTLATEGVSVTTTQLRDAAGSPIDITLGTTSGTVNVVVQTPQWLVKGGTSIPYSKNPYVTLRIDPAQTGTNVLDTFISRADSSNALQLTFPDPTDLIARYPQLTGGYINVYRSNTGGSATAFQYVWRFPITARTGVDTVANEFLQEVCPSETWIAPPDDQTDPDTGRLYYAKPLQKVVQFGNGILTGYTGRTACFSEPGLPHAWPAAYRVTLRHEIVDVCPVRDGVLFLTTGEPVLMVGDTPGAMGQIALDARYGCINLRSVVAIDGEAFYAAREGLIRAGSGGVSNITLPYVTEKQWREMFEAETYVAFAHEGRYIAQAGVTGTDVFSNLEGQPAYFIVAVAGEEVLITTASASVATDELPGGQQYALPAPMSKSSDGKTYFLGGSTTYYTMEWEPDDGDKAMYTWRSGEVVSPRAVALQTARLRYAADDGRSGTVTVIDGVTTKGTANLPSTDRPFRIPGGWRSDRIQVELVSQETVESVGVWDSMAEAR